MSPKKVFLQDLKEELKDKVRVPSCKPGFTNIFGVTAMAKHRQYFEPQV